MTYQYYVIKREVYGDKTFLFMLGYNHKRMVKFIYEVEEKAVHLHSKAVGALFIKQAHDYVERIKEDVNKGLYDNLEERKQTAVEIAAAYLEE